MFSRRRASCSGRSHRHMMNSFMNGWRLSFNGLKVVGRDVSGFLRRNIRLDCCGWRWNTTVIFDSLGRYGRQRSGRGGSRSSPSRSLSSRLTIYSLSCNALTTTTPCLLFRCFLFLLLPSSFPFTIESFELSPALSPVFFFLG